MDVRREPRDHQNRGDNPQERCDHHGLRRQRTTGSHPRSDVRGELDRPVSLAPQSHHPSGPERHCTGSALGAVRRRPSIHRSGRRGVWKRRGCALDAAEPTVHRGVVRPECRWDNETDGPAVTYLDGHHPHRTLRPAGSAGVPLGQPELTVTATTRCRIPPDGPGGSACSLVGGSEAVGVACLFGPDQVGDGVDQGEVGEGLGVVAQVPAGDRVQRLGVQAQR